MQGEQTEAAEKEEPKVSGLQWYKKLYRTYDRTFLTAMAVIYFV